MVRDSQDLNEYAFALGALSHYAADNNWTLHRRQPGRSFVLPGAWAEVRKAGNVCRRSGYPLKTEFAFDVFQAAKGRYAFRRIQELHRFEVAKPLLERAFRKIPTDESWKRYS